MEWVYFTISFLIGSIPTAYLVVRGMKGVDIRELGSGNVGATNAVRVLGKWPGAFVFAADFLKGFLPLLCFPQNPWLGLAPILGHVFTPFLRFKGGKGVATAAGVLCALFPLIFLMGLFIWVVAFLITKVVSISSLFSATSILVFAWFFQLSTESFIFLISVYILLAWTHRSNFKRLREGKEGSFNIK